MNTTPGVVDPQGDTGAAVAAGNLYLSCEVCQRFLPGIDSVALIRRDNRVLIVPLTRESGGGLLLKYRNSRGDRVIQAQEFFRSHALSEARDSRRVAIQWDDSAAALVLTDLTRDSN
jgi:hypothetical protein